MNRPARLIELAPVALLAALVLLAPPAAADGTYQTLPFTQSWTNNGLVTANDSWTSVPGIIGYRGDNLTASTGTDARTITAADSPGVVDVNANQTDPSAYTTGGVTEFELADPTIALAGSGTADAPYLLLHLNTTGQTSITVAYNVRDLDGSTDNAVQQVALLYRVGTTGAFTSVPAAYVADATSGPSLATLVTPVSVTLPAACDNQAQVQLRIVTTNAVGNDEYVGIDDISVTAGGGGTTLSVADATVTEGDSGTVTASFTVSLSAPAGVGGVSFDVATADVASATAGTDYVARSLAAQTIPQGSSSFTFDVTVNGDTAIEPDETFEVRVTNATGATIADGTGLGTITNDDFPTLAIHDIQGNGLASPYDGSVVTTTGVVTGLKYNNGFFIQEPDATVDADPATSEGIFVYTGSAPTVTVGQLVQVTGTIDEFAPGYGSITEFVGSPTVTVLSSGNALPAPVALSTSMPSPTGDWQQLEHLEGMRVTVPGFTVTDATDGSAGSNYTTGTSNGVFHGVVTGLARPAREAGIAFPNPPPSTTTIPPLLRWDSNPELIRVDSDGQIGAARMNYSARTVLPSFTGPLDYAFNRYSILPDVGSLPASPTEFGPTAVSVPLPSEVTIASYNLQRFYDDVDDPAFGSSFEAVLTNAQYTGRLAKASIGIRNYMRTPDVIGLVEVENLTTLQALATRINTDAVAASQPDPLYQAYLIEGNDVGAIDVGFLVKTAPVGGSPRVEVLSVTQELDGSLFTNADSSTETLHDRPPLVLRTLVHGTGGAAFPVTVIVNHLRSMNDVDSDAAGSNGWPTLGARVRAKRQAQAVDLANLVQARQTVDPTENIVLVGDYNAFDVNDSLGDLVGTILGTPAPDATTAVPGDGTDLVNPDLVNLGPLAPAGERYSYVFDGAAQMIDHGMVNAALVTATLARRAEFARINADFPEIDRTTTDVRLSDHDPLVLFLQVPAFLASGIATTMTDAPDPVFPGAPLTYTITVANGGPGAATGLTMTDTLPANTVFASLAAPAGWSCTTPAVGAGGTVTCTATSLAASTNAVFTLVVTVAPGVAGGTVLTNTASVTQTSTEGTPGDESATTTTTVAASADGAAVIPTLDEVGLGVLALLVGLGGALLVGRRLA